MLLDTALTLHAGGGFVETQCTERSFGFQQVDGREIVARFDGGRVTSDGGALLLRHTDRAIGLIERVAACFQDNREQDQVVHTLPALVGQRTGAVRPLDPGELTRGVRQADIAQHHRAEDPALDRPDRDARADAVR